MRRSVPSRRDRGKPSPRAFPALSCAAAALVLVLAGPAAGQQPAAPPEAAAESAAAEVAKARALMKEGRNLEALKILRPLSIGFEV